MKTWKRLLSMILAVVLMIGSFGPVNVKADTVSSEVANDNYSIEYDLYDYWVHLPEEWNYIDKSLTGRIYYTDNPEESYFETEVKSVTWAPDAESGSPEDMIEIIQREDGEGWDIHTLKTGTAILSIEHEDPIDKSQTITSTLILYVVNETWELEMRSSSKLDLLFPGEEICLMPNITRRMYSEERGHYNGDASQATVEWAHTDTDAFSFHIDEYGNYHICANAESSDAISVSAAVKDETGQEVAFWSYDNYRIVDNYYTIRWDGVEVTSDLNHIQWELGETKEIIPVLEWHSYEDGERKVTEVTEDVTFIADWWDGNVEVSYVENGETKPVVMGEAYPAGTAFQVKRIRYDYFQFNLEAQVSNEHRTWEGLGIGYVNYDVWGQSEYDGRFFDTESLFIPLDTSNIDGKENVVLNTEVYAHLENGPELLQGEGLAQIVTENNQMVLKLDGEKIDNAIPEAYEDWSDIGLEIQLSVTVNGVTLDYTMNFGAHLSRTRTDYHFMDTKVFLPDEWDGFENKMGVDVRTAAEDERDGAYYEVDVTKAELEIIDGAADAIVLHEREDKSGWELEFRSGGYGILTLTYTDCLDGSSKTYSIDVYCSHDRWNLTVYSSSKRDELLKGESIELISELTRDRYDEQTGERYYDEVVDDVDYVWTVYNTEEFSYETFDDGKAMKLTSNVQPHGDYEPETEVNLKIEYADEEGNLNVVKEWGTYFRANDEYYNIRWDGLPDRRWQVGEVLSITPVIVRHYNDENGQAQTEDVTEGGYLIANWWEDCVEVTNQNGEPIVMDTPIEPGTTYQLKRLATDYFEFNLDVWIDRGEDGEHHVQHEYIQANHLPYDIWADYDDRLFEDETYIVDLDISNLEGKQDLTFDAEFCVDVDGTGNNDTVIRPEDDRTYFEMIMKDDILVGLQLNGPEIMKFFEDYVQTPEGEGRDAAEVFDGSYVSVNIRIYANGVLASDNYIGFNLETTRVEYYYPGFDQMLPDDGYVIDPFIEAEIRSKDYKDGQVVRVPITDVAIENLDDSQASTIQELENGTGWWIKAVDLGTTRVTVTYGDALDTSIEQEYIFLFDVVGDIWYLDVSSDTDSLDLLAGEALTLTPYVSRRIYDGENRVDGPTDGAITEWTYPSESNFDFTVNQDGTLTIHAKDEREVDGPAIVRCMVYVQGENNEEVEVASWEHHFYLEDASYVIEWDGMDEETWELGETKEVTPVVYRYSKDEKGNVKKEEVTEDVMVQISWPDEFYTVTDAQGQSFSSDPEPAGTTFYITRISVYDTSFRIRASVDGGKHLGFDKSVYYDTLHETISAELFYQDQHINLLIMEKGETVQITAKADPDKLFDYYTPVWRSVKTDIATITDDGTITAVKAGATEVVLGTEDTGDLTSCVIYVLDVEADASIKAQVTELLAMVAQNQNLDYITETEQGIVLKAIQEGSVFTAELGIEETKAEDLKADDKTELDKKAAEVLSKDALLQYIDLSLILKTEDTKAADVHKLLTEIPVTLTIPEHMKGKKGKYAVVGLIDGAAVEKDVTVNEDGTITFKTDSLTTYVLAYEELPVEKTGWAEESGVWYYYDENGTAVTGWKSIEGTWYYFSGSGAMATGWKSINGTWYYFTSGGAMATGWQVISGTWYYFAGSGAMTTGWKSINGTWYYFTASGAMATGWQVISGTWYYFAASGTMATGWQVIGGTWYYFSGSGAMATGWQVIGGTWYYFSGSGAMATGWQLIDGTWYYFESGGAMVSGRTIRINGVSYKFNSSGAWVA